MYCTTADLDRIWGADRINLLATDRLTQQRDPARLAAAIEDAGAAINTYLAKRYPLPLVLSPDGAIQLRKLCADLAVYALATSADQMIEIIAGRYKDAMAQLRDVASARAEIAILPQGGGSDGPAALAINEAVISANDRAFTRDSLRGM